MADENKGKLTHRIFNQAFQKMKKKIHQLFIDSFQAELEEEFLAFRKRSFF